MRVSLLGILAALAFAGAGHAQEARSYYGLSPFELPALGVAEKRASGLLNAGSVDQAIRAFDALVKRYPTVPRIHVNHGIALALRGRESLAIDAFETGARLGFQRFRQVAGIAPLAKFMAHPRMKALVAAAPATPPPEVTLSPALPAIAQAGQLVVRSENVDFLAGPNILLVRTQFPERPNARFVAAGDAPWVGVINRLHAAGKAAGNHGDLYENRDGNHSILDLKAFPQLTRMIYDADIAQKHRLARGVNLNVITDAITLGNSSTAFEAGPQWRSLVRHAMTIPDGGRKLFDQHRANQIYIYPEVRDFEPEADHFPGYFADQIMSVGKSYSDQIPMQAAALALAAFQPAVKAEIKRRNLATPIVASILRRAQKRMQAGDFLSDAGHRSALDPEAIDLMQVITLANSMTMADIPPRVAIGLEGEPGLSAHGNVFAPIPTEVIYTAPTSIARRAYGTFFNRTYIMRAVTEGGEPGPFEWRVLAGDASRIVIKPLEADGSRVEVMIPWHKPFATAEGEITTRVDIGVFVKGGATWSSPAVLSLDFPRHQTRKYAADGRVLSIDYADPARAQVYADPRISFLRQWRDDYIYSDRGFEGWIRTQAGRETRYSATGDIVSALDALNRPVSGIVPQYQVKRQPNSSRLIFVVPSQQSVRWRYSGPTDFTGERQVSAP